MTRLLIGILLTVLNLGARPLATDVERDPPKAGGALSSNFAPTEEVQRALDEVYARKEFLRYRKAEPLRNPTPPDPGETPPQASTPRAPEKSLPPLWDFDVQDIAQLFTAVLLGLIALGVLWAMIYAIVQRKSKQPPADTSPQPEESLAEGVSTGRGPDACLSQARSSWHAADLSGAVRSILLAAMGWIERAERIRSRPGDTNGSYLRALRDDSERRQAFAAIARTYDQVRYGAKEVDDAQVESLLKLCGKAFGDAPVD